jgi:hypothetical protein
MFLINLYNEKNRNFCGNIHALSGGHVFRGAEFHHRAGTDN